MKSERALQPPLPANYKELYRERRRQQSMSIIMSIFVFSCLIQEVSNIKVVQNSMKISHETFWIALVAINLSEMYLLFKIGARISYFLFLIYLSFYILIVVCFVKIFIKQLKFSLAIYDCALWHIFRYFALEMGQSHFKLGYWSIFPITMVIGLSFKWIWSNISESFEQEFKRRQKKFNMTKQEVNRVIYKSFFQIHLLCYFSVYLVKIYINKQCFIILLTCLLVFGILLTILLLFFREELILYFNHPGQNKRKLLRNHQREFQHMNNLRILRFHSKEIVWSMQQCLQCQKKAQIVNIPCGHLVLCNKCNNKRWFRKCIICASNIAGHYTLNWDEKNNIYIYRRKVSIEKVPYKNLFEIVN